MVQNGWGVYIEQFVEATFRDFHGRNMLTFYKIANYYTPKVDDNWGYLNHEVGADWKLHKS